MIALVFGLLCLVAAWVVGLVTLVMAFKSPMVGALVLLPPFVGTLYWIYVQRGARRLHDAVFMHSVQESERFRRHS